MENYDYFMLKPESQRYFSEIINYIKEQNIQIDRFYKVNDWKNLSKKLYSEEFKKSDDFETGFESLAYITDCLYGNNAIIAVIKPNEDEGYEQFTKKVLQIKREIRELYKKSDSFFFIGNPINMPIDAADKKVNGKIKLQDQNGNLQEVPKGHEDGMYQFHSFNYIHCPNANEGEIKREFEILCDTGVLVPENIVSDEAVEQIGKYKSFNVMNREVPRF